MTPMYSHFEFSIDGVEFDVDIWGLGLRHYDYRITIYDSIVEDAPRYFVTFTDTLPLSPSRRLPLIWHTSPNVTHLVAGQLLDSLPSCCHSAVRCRPAEPHASKLSISFSLMFQPLDRQQLLLPTPIIPGIIVTIANNFLPFPYFLHHVMYPVRCLLHICTRLPICHTTICYYILVILLPYRHFSEWISHTLP